MLNLAVPEMKVGEEEEAGRPRKGRGIQWKSRSSD